jgi:transposase
MKPQSLLYCRKLLSLIKKGYTLSWFNQSASWFRVQTKERSIAVNKIRTKKVKRINEKTLIATVDIGKTMNMGYWRCPDGTEIKPFEFSNNRRGFNKYLDSISKAMKCHNLEEVVVGFESTGSYGEPFMHFWRKKKNVRLVQVNPMHSKKLKELQGNSPNKTDKKDPKVIADIIELGHALTVVVPEGHAAELRRLIHARERSIQRRTALWNQLQDLVFVIFPEFLQVMKNVKTRSAVYLLKNCPTPQDITAYGLEALTLSLKKISRGKLGAKRAGAIYEASKDSVGIEEGRKSILLEIREILAGIEACERFIAGLEEEMSSRLKEIPAAKFILSLKGIGPITTAGLIGEVGDFSKFHSIAEITKLAGFDLFEISSGKHKGNRRISKRGRPLMRKFLYLAALNTIRKGGAMHERYQKYLQRGMLKMKALVAVARKILGILFSLVRNHSKYIMGYSKTQNLKEAA